MVKVVRPPDSTYSWIPGNLVPNLEKRGYDGAFLANQGGQVIDRTPETLARDVLNGAKWIAYTLIPMYWYREKGNPRSPRERGFPRFLEEMGAVGATPETVDFTNREYMKVTREIELPPYVSFRSTATGKTGNIPAGEHPMFKIETSRGGTTGEYFYACFRTVEDFLSYANFIEDYTKAEKGRPIWGDHLGQGADRCFRGRRWTRHHEGPGLVVISAGLVEVGRPSGRRRRRGSSGLVLSEAKGALQAPLSLLGDPLRATGADMQGAGHHGGRHRRLRRRGLRGRPVSLPRRRWMAYVLRDTQR